MSSSPSTPKPSSKSPASRSTNLRRSSRLAPNSKTSVDGVVSGGNAFNLNVDEGKKKHGLDVDSGEATSVDESNIRVLGSSTCVENDANLDVVAGEKESRPNVKGSSVAKRNTRGSGSRSSKGRTVDTVNKDLNVHVVIDVDMDVDSESEKNHVAQDAMDSKHNDSDCRQDGEKKENNMSMSSDKLDPPRRSGRLVNALQRRLASTTYVANDMNLNPTVEKESESNEHLGELDSTETDLDRENTPDMDFGKVDPTSGSGGSRRRSERLAMTEQGNRAALGRGKRKCQVDLNFPPSHEDGGENGILDSHPGVRSTRRRVEGVDIVTDTDREQTVGDESGDAGHMESVVLEANLVSNEGNAVNGSRRYSREEKGKESMVRETWLSIGMSPVDLDMKSEEEHLLENAVSELSLDDAAASGLVQLQEKAEKQAILELEKANTRWSALYNARTKAHQRKQFREQHLDIAREKASHFALFNAEDEEDNNTAPVDGSEELLPDADQEIEDWPGPFSTAMKIIRDRAMNLDARLSKLTTDVSKGEPVINWIPSEGQNQWRPAVPSLQDMCLEILAKNAEALVSLENVPDVLRNKLSQMLCDSRRMDNHFMGLLARGSPTEICVKDSSFMTEEQITGIFGRCDMRKLMVLQLDLCGRCMPDYVLRSTLARSPNSLPALVTLSLRGACRLTDSGLCSLVASAPLLRSINLGQCSLLTSIGINSMADSLGSVVRELYLDDCQNIDAMLVLPALKKLEHLEVLSVAGIQTVCNSFVQGFAAECGSKMKELVLKNCEKLTDTSVKAIAENCSGLLALDLVNLRKLTDSSLGYLANECQSIQKLKLCRNAFSDEAIAAFLEASGETLVELSVNNVKEVGHNTAISLARRCSVNLLHLDLSFCRKLADEALGLIVDSCSSLRVLKLFGCTQVTNKFLNGHSNPSVQIIGSKMSPLFKSRSLRYSSVRNTES